IVGFSIGLIPQIRKALIGDGAPLRVVQDTASLLGDGAIPILTLIIGGNLLKGLRGPGMQKSLVVGIIIVRYVALPLIGILVIKGALKLGLVHSDPLYLFVLLLQFSLPPAMNIGTMTQLFGAGEKECSVIMLWTYAFASVSLTFWSAFFMWLVARV
ncbi:PREDICTED: PIN-LIKES, partial [Prunus dulcis]